MLEHVAEKIDNALGEFVESDPKNYDKPKKKFIRLRHIEKFFRLLLNKNNGPLTRKFTLSIRATTRRNPMTLGSWWLREGAKMEVGDESMQNGIGKSGMSEVQHSNGLQTDKEGVDSIGNESRNSKMDEVMDMEGGGDLAGRLSAKSAEAIAIREVLSWVNLQNWDRVIIESDAKIVVQAINDDSYEDSSSFGNSVAHVLATGALFTSGLGEWFEISPLFIVEVLALE
ncbi:hypothetical protein K2173_009382 [Erythroxylum novogranatense]|uniref:RNase H type-1 domain-containing protein n=1 Tax=Erythroxylum novogranatense TaxID=1862640 RepID=A0AAV8U3T7_9ROSI|nr:hypothetical protein K2173_009382 [Erythroxylum novogranatense]